MSGPVVFPLAVIEGVHLSRLVEDLGVLVKGADGTDPAVARLTPNPYPDDQDAAETFADGTRQELLGRRREDTRVVRAALQAFAADPETLTEEQALLPIDVVVAEEHVGAWLRTLTALRLVMAERMGISDDDHTTDDPRYAVYDWVGYRLEVLVQAADEQG